MFSANTICFKFYSSFKLQLAMYSANLNMHINYWIVLIGNTIQRPHSHQATLVYLSELFSRSNNKFPNKLVIRKFVLYSKLMY